MIEPLPLARTSPLPRPRTRLVGREVEVAAARAALLDEAVPLLSLLGPGGVGKTRLALAIAEVVAGAFADGSVWVDLAPLADPGLVPGALAGALNVTPKTDQTIEEALVHYLRPRQTLLLLDNCEHLIVAAAELIAALLAACPALQCLATSRAPLRIRGEQELLVDPLPLPPAVAESLESLAQNEAVALFVERARAVRPTFTLVEANAPSVAALCRRLDGLPLAIELAAARSRILSPAALLAQMSDRLRLLSGGPRDLPARQQTIEATIAWSYDLLDPEAQRLFRQLAVFADGCDLEAATAVAGEETPLVLERLGALRDQALLRSVESADQRSRFTMLETIREYALARLDERGEAAAARDAHAAHFLALAEEAEAHVRGPEQVSWLGRLVVEYPNLRAAMGWLRERGDAERSVRLAGALFLFWQMRNDFAEGRQWLADALTVPGATRSAAWAKAQTALGYMTTQENDLPRARAMLTDALRVWRELGDRLGAATTQDELAVVALNEGNLQQARALGEEALATYRAFGDDFRRVYALHGLGVVSLLAGDYRRARAELEESLRLATALRVPVSRLATRALGWLSLAEGDARSAASLWEERLAWAREVGHEQAMCTYLDDLGWLRVRQEDLKTAAGLFAEELALAAKLGDPWHEARGLAGLAVVGANGGQVARAAWLFGAAEAMAIDAYLDDDLFNPVRAPYERARETVRRGLGDVRFAEAWGEGRALPPRQAIARALAEATSPDAPPERREASWQGAYDRLTPRETEVLRLLARRLTDKEIAAALYISPRTVGTHLARILEKLGVKNRREAGAVAARLGLV